MTIASGVQPFNVCSNPELNALTFAGHDTKPVVITAKIAYAGSSGAPDYKTPPTGFHLSLSGAETTGPLNRLKVGVVGYVQWANDPTYYKNYLYDKDGFWIAVQVDATCTTDGFQVDWLAYWL